MPTSALAKKYPDTVDDRFAKHWDTWFTQNDIEALKVAGINTVRLPVSISGIRFASVTYCTTQLGYWIVEDLVDRAVEYYPRGGLKYLVRSHSIVLSHTHRHFSCASASRFGLAARCRN